MEKCLKCGCETEYVCDECHEPLCEDCGIMTSPPDLPLERHICEYCYTGIKRERSEEYIKEEALKEIFQEKRNERNRKARIRYNSSEARDKREQDKKERKEKARIEMLASLKELFGIVDDLLGKNK